MRSVMNKNGAFLSNFIKETFSRRTFSTSKTVSAEFQQEGIPGSNIPFSIKNRYLLTIKFALFFSTALTAPFLIMRRQLLLTNGGGEGAGADTEVQNLSRTYCPKEEKTLNEMGGQ